jgi:hypothetical protein
VRCRGGVLVGAAAMAHDAAMRDGTTIRESVEKARRRHDEIAEDRVHGEGHVGDEELLALLEAAYPTLTGQRN